MHFIAGKLLIYLKYRATREPTTKRLMYRNISAKSN